ncbi:MAG: serine/threonine-protein kinase [Nostoc sp.]|uniref:serine/threonine protein kinase n=1 Tax=Nostoc sp. TaxID=1180 RepID=UPI002FFCE1CA
MPPRKFGDRWELIEQIGEGGQSHVFLVKDLKSQYTEKCVLKRLKNTKRIERFEQEIRAGRELNHSGIAPILDYSLDSEPYFFVTKHYPGTTLTDLAPLEPLKALAIFTAICGTVAYAHEKSIVHRDLKPDNIILDQDNNPVILDFGICYFIDEGNRLTETMEQVGSRYYIAPELEGGRSEQVTWAVDSYALGKILYFLLTGKIFARENYNDSNSLSHVCQNHQLDYITQRILDESVVEQPEKRLSVAKLKEESETVRRLIYEHFYPGKVGSRCRFCGEGFYELMPYAGLKAFRMIQESQSRSYPSQDFYMNCEPISCNLCGSIQWFKVKTPVLPYI